VVNRLLEMDNRLWVSRSWTTRPPRPGEPSDAYVFVDRPTFEARVAAGGFLEWTEFAGNGCLYGTPTLEASDGYDVVLEIELDGAAQVKDAYPDALVVLIVAPSIEEQEVRLRGRGDDDGSVTARLAVGIDEERVGRAFADAIVVNDDVTRAALEVAGILADARRRRDR
jgi:guanylate kinase